MQNRTKTTKVSIIIPVYNAEKYLMRCLDSAFEQTYLNIEVVCVDDGSRDGSLMLLKDYQKSHPNLTVLHQDNKGAAAARNYGLETSTGEYVTFIDSDDAIKPDFIEQLVGTIGDNDVIFSGHERRDGDNILGIGYPLKDSAWTPYKFNQTCGKLYRRNFLSENNIAFPVKYHFNEDVFVTLLILSHTDKIKITDYAGYIAYHNPKSLTNTSHIGNKDLTAIMIRWLDDIEVATASSDHILTTHRLFFYLKIIITELYHQRNHLTNSEYYQAYKAYFTWLKSTYAKYGRKLNFYIQSGETPSVNLVCNAFIFATKTHTAKILLSLINHNFRMQKRGDC